MRDGNPTGGDTAPHQPRSVTGYANQLEKVACGAFSDISFVAADKKRGFCRLRTATPSVANPATLE
jgi:hypothetical protein